ncbi:LysR family transcriptional regulator [Spirillospora sp. NPDC047279]|uniref:LysR family transcriptional regulator n=1 Tax=Spirillospora sp. NPDC047279 TaxID=3155478 RepID=UPI0034009B53
MTAGNGEQGPPLRDVGCFAAVARDLSFSRAAVRLGMSQPAVSQAIARLERSLDLRLFARTSREVQLTAAGRALLPHAEALLEQAAAFSAEAGRLAGPRGKAIGLAYDPLVGTLAAQVARRLARNARSAGAEVELRPAAWADAMAELVRGTATVAIMSAPFPPGLATTARFHVPVTHLAVPAGGPLAGTAPVRLEQLTGHPLLLPRALWVQLPGRLRTALQRQVVAHDVDDLAAALDLVAAGRGLMPAPRLLAETVRRPDIGFPPLGLDDLRMTYGLVWDRENASAEVMAIVQTVQEALRRRGVT